MYNFVQLNRIYNFNITKAGFLKAEASGNIPKAERNNENIRGWSIDQLPEIGEKFGFLSELSSITKPVVISLIASKGGCLKTSIAFNLARIISMNTTKKTIVVGLDYQCDISNLLSHGELFNENLDENFNPEMLDQPVPLSLYDFFTDKNVKLDDLIQATDLPNLQYITESPQLNMLSEILSTKTKREHVLKTQVINELRKHYDFIIMDLSPSWSTLTTNAIVASDILITPLETRINHLRNLPLFTQHIAELKEQLELAPLEIYVPVKYESTKKLTVSIRNHYYRTYPDLISAQSIRNSIHMEESIAKYSSVIESHPTSPVAEDIRELVKEVVYRVAKHIEQVNTVSKPATEVSSWH